MGYGGESERMLQLSRACPPCPWYSAERGQLMLWLCGVQIFVAAAGYGSSALLVFVGTNCLMVFWLPPARSLNAEDKCLYAK